MKIAIPPERMHFKHAAGLPPMSRSDKTIIRVILFAVIVYVVVNAFNYYQHRNEDIHLVGKCPEGKTCECVDKSCTLMEVEP